MLLSNFIHKRQRLEADCLLACAEMALAHLDIELDEARLRKILRVGTEFTPFHHLRYLERLGLSISRGEQGDVSIFEAFIESGLPVLIAVKTIDWPHWGEIVTEHAVVVVGIDHLHDRIYINDPFFAEAPLEMSLQLFEIGWEEKARQYAVISLELP